MAVVSLMIVGVESVGVRAASAACPDLELSDDYYTTNFGQPVGVFAPGLLANDIGTNLRVEVWWGQANANPDPSDDYSLFAGAEIEYGNPAGPPNRQGGFTYMPDPTLDPFSGIDQFDYWAIDSCGNDDLATAYITVVPTVVDSDYVTPLDTPLTVAPASGFLANDQGVDPFSLFFDTTSGQGGAVDDSGFSDGSFTYTPPAGFSGADSFGYSVDDLNGDNTYYGTVHIQVGGPAAPTAVTAVTGDHQATVSWGVPDSNGSPITSYTVTSSPGGLTANGSASPLTVGGLTNGTSYTFTVHASNANGAGTESAASNAVIPDDGLAPTVAMTAPSLLVQLSPTVTAKWNGSDSSGIEHFDARRSVAAWNGSPGAWTAWNASSATTTAYAGTYGRTYCFGARAQDAAGHVSGWTASRCTAVPLRADQAAFSAHWTKVVTSASYANVAESSKTKGAKMTRNGIVAKRLVLIVAKCAACGTVQVRWNNVVIANLNLKSSTTLQKQMLQVANWPSVHSGTLTVTVTSPTGKSVVLEGLAVYNG